MKRSRIHIVSAVGAIVILGGICSCAAQQLFPVILSTTCISTNQTGMLVYQHNGNQDLISACAADEGITNVSGLSLVFNPAANALQVVAPTNLMSVGTNHMLVGSNQFLICTSLTFSNFVTLTGTDTNKVELLASVFVESNSLATGTLVATERTQFNSSNELSNFSLVGRIQYAEPAMGTNSAEICSGVLVAGTFVGSGEENGEGNENENDNDHGGNHGNQGNHGNGNQGNGHGNQGNHGDQDDQGNGNQDHHGRG